MTDEEKELLVQQVLSDPRIAQLAWLIDQSDHWWREGQKTGPDGDVARANAALAWAFLQAEMRD